MGLHRNLTMPQSALRELDGRRSGHHLAHRTGFIGTNTVPVFGTLLVPEVIDDAIHDLIQGNRRQKTRKPLELAERGYAPRHIFESWLVSLIVRDISNRRLAVRSLFHEPSQPFDRNFVRVAYIDDLPDCLLGRYESQDRLGRIPDIAKTTRLLTCSKHCNRFTCESLAHKVRQHHPVTPGLTGSYRIE